MLTWKKQGRGAFYANARIGSWDSYTIHRVWDTGRWAWIAEGDSGDNYFYGEFSMLKEAKEACLAHRQQHEGAAAR